MLNIVGQAWASENRFRSAHVFQLCASLCVDQRLCFGVVPGSAPSFEAFLLLINILCPIPFISTETFLYIAFPIKLFSPPILLVSRFPRSTFALLMIVIRRCMTYSLVEHKINDVICLMIIRWCNRITVTRTYVRNLQVWSFHTTVGLAQARPNDGWSR